MKEPTTKTAKTAKANKKTAGPDRGDPLYEEVRVVRDRVEEVLGVITYLAHDPELVGRQEASIRTFFKKNPALARVYLALSADRNIAQVAALLNVRRQSLHESIQKLAKVQPRLIMKMNAGGRGDVWIRNATLEGLLQLSAKIRKWTPELEPVTLTADEEPVTSPAEEPAPSNDTAKQATTT